MTRQKKTRKVGKIGVSKTSSNVRTSTEKRVKKPLGKPAGSRNSETLNTGNPEAKRINKDPRHGSKKPISLVVDKSPVKATAKKETFFSPAQELAAIEKDQRLATLLEKVDAGKAIAKDDQQYLDRTLARHKVLCNLLGLTDDEDNTDETTEQSDDLYSKFESIDINDFKN
jgi:ribosome assembly protein YihI (activator of Der GTPase)